MKVYYLLEIPRSQAKMCLKSASQKLNFAITQNLYQKVIYWIVAAAALVGSDIITHSNAASFSIKITLCETNSILFSKN